MFTKTLFYREGFKSLIRNKIKINKHATFIQTNTYVDVVCPWQSTYYR